jgi:predicted O-methyltransferase YrrM
VSFDRAELDRSPWSLGSAAFDAVVAHLEVGGRPPQRILEFGSGASTRAFADRFPSADIVAVDHDARFLPALADLPAPERVKVVVTGLRWRVLAGIATWTYDWDPEGVFDIALVDGPPRSLGNGRLGALILAYAALRPGGLVFLDDATRSSELRCLAALTDLTGARPRFLEAGHGLAVVERRGPLRASPRVTVRSAADSLVTALARVC